LIGPQLTRLLHATNGRRLYVTSRNALVDPRIAARRRKRLGVEFTQDIAWPAAILIDAAAPNGATAVIIL
jgi:hypothetical protein